MHLLGDLLILCVVTITTRMGEQTLDSGFFKNMEKKTGVNMKDIFELASSLQTANFKDEQTVRGVIKRVAQMANKPVSKEVEDKLVQSIVNDGKTLDINSITKMMNKTIKEN
ncbi:MAG: sporulation protein [Bacillales bacterium]|nr:sporulation protein [Bacillales bacterium]